MFDFTVGQSDSKSSARTGVFTTPHGDIRTPVFMPVGTKAGVKTLSPFEVDRAGADIILANTYHMYLRPGHELVKKMGGLHAFQNWHKPILTDSGGFQVFSLGHMNKITEKGVEFRSVIDGSKHFFSPERAIEIQHDLGADIIMAFDECAAGDSTKEYARAAMERTHRWILQCKEYHEKSGRDTVQALFPIVQGVIYDDLRRESAQFMADLDLPGVAIGGLSVGESKEDMYRILDVVDPVLPKNKPRYLMGVGTPEDLLHGVSRGVDMFDCVLPTRNARHGGFFHPDGVKAIKKAEYFDDAGPLQEGCDCEACVHHSRSYIRHLFKEGELYAGRLLTIHNTRFMIRLMEDIRRHIETGTFMEFKDDFLARYEKGKFKDM
ncbi:MAG: tRNA guanosine(34) transglycosylase Tgt [Patescibacteria group bacterium]|nr:tRNA guanosine(34) transglycosylase Tgt [Patescibacteria group bacterium]